MKVIDFTTKYYEKWDRLVAATQLSTFYHQSRWFDILEKTFGYKQVGFLQMDGDRIVGGLPLFSVRRFIGKSFISSPFRDRGGVLCLPGVDPRHLLERAVCFCRKHGTYILIKQMDALDEAIVSDLGYIKSSYWITTQVDLTKGSEYIWKGLKNNAQGPVKQAVKKGVVARIADSPNDMDIFYRIFLCNRKRLGIPSFSKSFFLRLWNRMSPSGNIRLILAKLNKKPLAGILLLIHKDTVIDGYAASLPECRRYRANDLLVWKSIEWACDSGYKVFDFGADSSRQNSLLAFKRKWNGSHKRVYYYHYLHKSDQLPNIDSSSYRYVFFRKVLSALPMPVFRFASHLIVSRFG